MVNPIIVPTLQAAASEQPENRHRAPGKARAARGEREQQRNRRRHHQKASEYVELMRALVARQPLERLAACQKGQKTERDVDPENQRPVQIFRQHASEQRAGD
jgi:hypothetical protein